MFKVDLRTSRLAGPTAVLVAVVAAVLVISYWPSWQERRLAAAWQAELLAADVDRAPGIVEKLADLGDAGIAPLVAGLAADPPVSEQVAAALETRLNRWELSDAETRSRVAARLAAAFAQHVENFPPAARRRAIATVNRILLWSLDPQVVDRAAVIADCERVLLAVDDADDDSEQPANTARTDDVPARRASWQQADRDAALSASIPGGGLPIAANDAPRLPQAREPADSIPKRDPREPRLLFDGNPDELPPSPLPGIGDPNRALPSPRLLQPTGGAATSASADSSSGRFVILAGGEAASREVALIRQLSAEAPAADEAETALRSQGYEDDDFALVNRLTSGDAAARAQAIDEAARQGTRHARRWLEMLVDDPEASVRLAAMTQLATSGDAALINQLRRRASQDADPAVRRLAEVLGAGGKR